MFILPTAITKTIDSILTSFLWKGPALTSAGPKIAWASICVPKEEGGLGIIRVKEWNKAAIAKHIWRIFKDKNSLWPSWIHSVILRGKSFWSIHANAKSSWSWRKTFNSAPGAATISPSRSEMEETLFFGKTRGFLKGLFATTPPLWLLHPQVSQWKLIKVSEVIDNGHWNFPSCSPSLNSIWSSVPFQPNMNCSDTPLLNGKPSFTIRAAWDSLRYRRNSFPSHNAIWFKGHIPRHAFIFWLASQCRLNTTDRVVNRGATISSVCVLCKKAFESHDHLFFNCPFAEETWHHISVKTFIHWQKTSIPHLSEWTATHVKNEGNPEHVIGCLALSATIYAIWQERNTRIFSNKANSNLKIIWYGSALFICLITIT